MVRMVAKLPYEYFKTLVDMKQYHLKKTYFCEMSLTNEKQLKEIGFNFTGGTLIVYFAPPCQAYSNAYLSLSVLFYHTSGF